MILALARHLARRAIGVVVPEVLDLAEARGGAVERAALEQAAADTRAERVHVVLIPLDARSDGTGADDVSVGILRTVSGVLVWDGITGADGYAMWFPRASTGVGRGGQA